MNERETPNSERFSNETRQVLAFTQEEALRVNHNFIGTEHILLGLIREGSIKGILERCNVPDLSKVRSTVEFIIGRGDHMVAGEISFTPRAKKVLVLATNEANRDNTFYVSPNYLLRGLVREGEGIAAGVLESLAVSLDKLHRESKKIKSKEPEEVLKRIEAFFEDPDIDRETKDKIRSILGGLIELAIERKNPPSQN